MSGYARCFWVYRCSNDGIAGSYILGLMRCKKSHTNMERMVELDSEYEYHQYTHFLSEFNWDATPVNEITARNAFSTLSEPNRSSGLPTMLIVDESSHLKKGTHSVGVARQIGKVDNCQVAVYASLSNRKYTTPADGRLYLPQGWTSDPGRMDEAHVPDAFRTYKAKPELALEIIRRAQGRGLEIDRIAGDGLYGHNGELTRALDREQLFYVLDVHGDEHVYLQEPVLSVPPGKGDRGRNTTRLQSDQPSVCLEDHCKGLKPSDWQQVKVRKTAKGTKIVQSHIVKVRHWDGKGPQACERTLVITCEQKSKRIKYSFSNAGVEEYSAKEYAYSQCNRYWVERSFDGYKIEPGLSGYQVRIWDVWHHHIALVMMASLCLLKRKIDRREQYPLMSIGDARILMIAGIFGNKDGRQRVIRLMEKRHEQRQKDIDRYFRMEREQDEQNHVNNLNT